MVRRDLFRELREVLREAVAATRMTPFEIEQRLGLGHGSLNRLLDGSMEPRLYHLTGIAQLLDVHPKEFLEMGLAGWPARHRLLDWMSLERRQAAVDAAALPAEMAAAVRALVREELARHGIATEPGAAAASPQAPAKPAASRSRARKKPPTT